MTQEASTRDPVYIIFDGPSGHESGRFVEVEDAEGRGQRVGEWKERDGGLWALGPFVEAAQRDKLLEAVTPLMAFAEGYACDCEARDGDGAVEHDCAPDAEEAREAVDEARAAIQEAEGKA